MTNWGRRPEFNHNNIPQWRRRLDWILLSVATIITTYNVAYVGLGLYYGEIDHEKERLNFKKADERINKILFGKSNEELSSIYKKFHNSISIVELAQQIKAGQEKKDDK